MRLSLSMARSRLSKYVLYLVLVLVAVFIIWYFQLEEEHAMKSKIKSFIRAIT